MGFRGTNSKEKSHNDLKLLFLKRRNQFISKNLTVFSGYFGYMFLDSNPELGPSFIAKLSVSEKNSYGGEHIFLSFTRKKNLHYEYCYCNKK